MPDNQDGQPPEEFANFLLSKLRNDPDWFLYDALNSALPAEQQLKPWDEMDAEQRAAIVLHVSDMSLWRAEGKVDSDDAEVRFQTYPELRELLA